MDLISRLGTAGVYVIIGALATFLVVNADAPQSQLEHDIERWATAVLVIACAVTVFCGIIVVGGDQRWRR